MLNTTGLAIVREHACKTAQSLASSLAHLLRRGAHRGRLRARLEGVQHLRVVVLDRVRAAQGRALRHMRGVRDDTGLVARPSPSRLTGHALRGSAQSRFHRLL